MGQDAPEPPISSTRRSFKAIQDQNIMDENNLLKKFKVIKTKNNPKMAKLTMLKKIERFNKLDEFLNKKPGKVLERNCLLDLGMPTQEKKARELGDKGYMVGG